MNWTNVRLILSREIRDQLRDRRTLFMIAVLPMLLYPLLGMSYFQVVQFMQDKPSSVLIVGARDLADLPPLIENCRFSDRLFNDPEQPLPDTSGPTRLLELHFAPAELRGGTGELSDQREEAHAAVLAGTYDAAVYFPPDFADRLETFRQTIRRRADRALPDEAGPQAAEEEVTPEIPSPEIIYSTANEKSQVAFVRLSAVLRRWTEKIGETNLAAAAVPRHAAKPFQVDRADVAEETGHRGAAIWSKILPILLLVWAMTGAFYPAVDLCAGEKERGTLETLLSSPAERSEIVLGKLLTIMLFSMATAALNLISMGITGWLLLARLDQFGAPPLMAVVWLSIALVPVSALFSALCLALAAFARSTKEGQYYLMPLLLVTMPLVVLPMAPGVELNLGNSLIPITGVVLLLRSALEGNHWEALQFLPPVLAVTLGACLLSIRWAVDQFNSESVLFREGERLDVGLWLRHLLQDRGPTPTVAGAVFCGVAILLVRFFMSLAVPTPSGPRSFAVLAIVTQLVVVATPALLMTVMLTNSPRQTLLLRRPPWLALPAAAALAIVLHPCVSGLQIVVTRLYPPSQDMMQFMGELQEMLAGGSFWQIVLIMAVLPAVCEELAFRGFILSGFRHLGHKWRAIAYSALFFGISHALLQQSLIACLVGVVIGILAVQSGSIWPCMVFHVTHNTLAMAAGRISPQWHEWIARWPAVNQLVSPTEDGGMLFHWPALVISALLAFAMLAWFQRLSFPKAARQYEWGS